MSVPRSAAEVLADHATLEIFIFNFDLRWLSPEFSLHWSLLRKWTIREGATGMAESGNTIGCLRPIWWWKTTELHVWWLKMNNLVVVRGMQFHRQRFKER